MKLEINGKVYDLNKFEKIVKDKERAEETVRSQRETIKRLNDKLAKIREIMEVLDKGSD